MKNIKLQRKTELTAKKETKQKTNLKPKNIYKGLINQRKFYDIEYTKYVRKIGLCLYNNDHPTILFNFLNVGSID